MVVWLLEREVFADGDEGLAAAARRAGDRVVAWRDDWWVDGRWPAASDSVSLRALDHGFHYDDEELAVVVMPAVGIGAEWRLVVAAGRVVAGSGYVADGRTGSEPIGPDHPASTCASGLLARLPAPDPVYVLDVCETGAGLRLLELNPFSGADLYGCDREAVVAGVRSVR